jgi:protein SCO1
VRATHLLPAALAALALAGCAQTAEPAPGHRIGAFLDATKMPAALAGRKAPPIRLRESSGARLDTAAWRGRPYAVVFAYANCGPLCQLIADELRESLVALGPEARRVAVVSLSVDPHGDTPAAVRAFLARHHEPPNFHYAIGTQSQLQPIWSRYEAAPLIPGDPQTARLGYIWLVDGQGRVRALFDASSPFRPAVLAHDFRVLLRRR